MALGASPAVGAAFTNSSAIAAHRGPMTAASIARTAVALLACSVLGGCIARTAASVITAPVRVVSKGVDLATTSQSEADEKRGRDMRLRERRLGELDRAYRRHSAQCSRGDEDACRAAQRDHAEIDRLYQPPPRHW